MKENTKRLIAFICAAACAAAVYTGCASAEAADPVTVEQTKAAEEQTQQQAEPEITPVRDTVVIATESEPPTLHPFDHKSVTAGYMNLLTYSCLFMIDVDTLQPVPDLCRSYENVSETEWLFTIYDNVTFHDGTHMTAEDVKASMEYGRAFATTKDYTSFWTDIEVVDDYTIKVTTDGPYALTLFNLASIKIVPKALIDEGNDFNQNPIGSGPYVFQSYTLGDRIEFEAFEDYFREGHKAQIKHMTWRIIPEGSSRTIALEAGEVDLVVEVDANDVARLESDENVAVCKVDGTRLNFFSVNTEVYPFNNQDFRKALNAAIDRDAVVAVACNGEATKAIAQTPVIFEGSTDTNAVDYDPEAAKTYLESSGIDPETISFSCIVSNDAARRAAEVIQAELLELGITMDVENMDYATQLTAIMSGDYEASIIGYTSSHPCIYLSGFYHSSAINAANLTRLNDPEVDRLIDLSKTQIDDAERAATLTEVNEYLNELAPLVPLYQTRVVRAANAKIGGFDVSASGNSRFEDIFWAE